MSGWPAPNYALLNTWNDPANKRPPTRGNLRDPHEMPPDWHESCDRHMHVGEVHQEAYNAHLILDLLGVPPEAGADAGGSADLDARVSVFAQEFSLIGDRLDRIAGWHARETGEHGTVGDYCTECGHVWPCDSRKMADGSWTDADDADQS